MPASLQAVHAYVVRRLRRHERQQPGTLRHQGALVLLGQSGEAGVFVPGRLDAPTIGRLVEGIGDRKMSVLGVPGTPPPAELASLGVARVSYGPFTQRVALTALADVGADLLAGGVLPPTTRSFD